MEPAPAVVSSSYFPSIIKRKNAFYIDKTEFVKDFINKEEISVILRPRRFGKSTNLSTLESFLSIHSEVESFEQFIIGKDQDFCKAHFKKYPVVELNFKDIGGKTWEELRPKIWAVISEAFRHHLEMDKLESFKNINFKSINPPETFYDVINLLTQALHRKYGQKVIVLIDEYDAPLMKASKSGYFEEASTFFNEFYSSTLKDNRSVYGACLVGIMEVRKTTIFSGLNNCNVYSVADEDYAKYFGFSEEEITPYCKSDELKDVLLWYNGHRIGNYKMINPWSFTTWLSNGKLGSHWVGTSAAWALVAEVAPHLKDVFPEVCKYSFIDGYEKSIKNFSPEFRHDRSNFSYDDVWNLLIQTGYLSFIPDNDSVRTGRAVLPNKELYLFWKDDFLPLITRDIVPEELSKSLVTALKYFEVEELPGAINDLFNSVPREEFPHMLAHCLVFGICRRNYNCNVVSTNATGDGYYDLVLESGSGLKIIVIKFMKSFSEDKLDIDAENGLNDINPHDYTAKFPNHSFLLIAVSFCGESVSQLKYKIHPEVNSDSDPDSDWHE